VNAPRTEDRELITYLAACMWYSAISQLALKFIIETKQIDAFNKYLKQRFGESD